MSEKRTPIDVFALTPNNTSANIYAVATSHLSSSDQYNIQFTPHDADYALIGPSKYLVTAVSISERLKELDNAHTIAGRYAELKGVKGKKKKEVRKTASLIIDKLTNNNELLNPLSPLYSDIEEVRLKLKTIRDKEVNNMANPADLSTLDRKLISNKVAIRLLSGKYTSSQVEDLLTKAGYTNEERLRIIKMLKISAIFAASLNVILGSASEAVALYMGVRYHDEILQYINTFDPETRNIMAVALANFSQTLVYMVTDLKNKMSIKMYEEGINTIPDPIVVAQNLIDKHVISPKERFTQIVSRWIAHFINPLNLADERWYASLAVPDFGVTFSSGNFIATGIKTGVITVEYLAILSKRLKIFESIHEKYIKKYFENKDIQQNKVGPENDSSSLATISQHFTDELVQALLDPKVLKEILRDYPDIVPQKDVKEEEKPPPYRRTIFSKGPVLTKNYL